MPLVPKEDLPSDLVPESDLPSASAAAPAPAPAPQKDVIGEGLKKYHEQYSGPGGAYQVGGKATDLGMKMGLSPETAAKLGVAANFLTGATESALTGYGMKSVAKPVEQWGARWLMRSSLKPDKMARESGKAEQAVTTMLDKNLRVSSGGAAKLKGMIDTLNNEIKSAIERSPHVVDKNAVASYADDLAGRVKMQVTPGADMSTVKRAVEEWLNHPLLRGEEKVTEKVPGLILSEKGVPFETTREVTKQVSKPTMSVQEAQALKQGTYRELGKKAYGELKGADVEAQKALARGLKEEIAKLHPEIDKMNKEESDALNAWLMAEARAQLEKSKDPLGLGVMSPSMKNMAIWLLNRNAWFKSWLANQMYRGGVSGGLGMLGGGAVGAYGGMPPRMVPNESQQPANKTSPEQPKPFIGVRG